MGGSYWRRYESIRSRLKYGYGQGDGGGKEYEQLILNVQEGVVNKEEEF